MFLPTILSKGFFPFKTVECGIAYHKTLFNLLMAKVLLLKDLKIVSFKAFYK